MGDDDENDVDMAHRIAETVAELEEKPIDELTPLWEVTGDALYELFEDPPHPSAQFEVTFSYEGYRITVGQDGTATFVRPA